MVLNETLIEAINETMPILTDFVTRTHSALNLIQYLIGGIFGWYIISSILRFYMWKKSRDDNKRLRKELNELKTKLNKLIKKK